jgi:hypothetical protein
VRDHPTVQRFHNIVAALERAGVQAVNPPMAFPMEAERWPRKMWLVSHKPVAVAAGLSMMGIHHNVIHPTLRQLHPAGNGVARC